MPPAPPWANSDTVFDAVGSGDGAEAAEFDTRVPHAWGNARWSPVEVLSLFGSQGERMHVRAKPRRTTSPSGEAQQRMPNVT